jgi:hypothetical protein
MQISDEEKALVTAEAREAARSMGQEALSKRLEEIGMREFEYLLCRFFDPAANVDEKKDLVSVSKEILKTKSQKKKKV